MHTHGSTGDVKVLDDSPQPNDDGRLSSCWMMDAFANSDIVDKTGVYPIQIRRHRQDIHQDSHNDSDGQATGHPYIIRAFVTRNIHKS